MSSEFTGSSRGRRRVRAQTSRFRKLLYRTGWRARGALAGRPSVQVLHRHGDEWVGVCDEPALIEPGDGFVITERGALLDESLASNFDYDKATWRLGLPSPRRLLPRDAHVESFPCVISLRHRWEWNYYHFFLDVLGKLELIDQSGVDRDTPIVLGRYAHQLPFAREVLSMGALGDRRWVVPDADDRLVVRAERIVYCRTRRPYGERIAHLLRELDAPEPDAESDARIYVTRCAPASRRVSNEAELLPVLAHFGFRIIDAAQLSMREQMEIFARARHVVALHGAGVTNVIFRCGAPLDVLELHGDRFAGPGDMERLCAELGYRHHSLSGPSGAGPAIHADFRIDPAQLHEAITTMVADGSPPPVRRA